MVIRDIFNLPIRNKNANDCCDSPDAKNLSVIARRSAGGIAFLKFVSFFLILGQTRVNK